jgi:1-aminocyclopropane-1-carboxylate deaminase/D-cysteine desulfhydrase-like pyridoxal-dependent ACC family enzyme
MQYHQPPPSYAATLENYPITVLRWDVNNHPVSGNKAEKLAWQLQLLEKSPHKRIFSMGGPWSNHLHALGFACQTTHHTCTALIRGEAPKTPSPTLRDLTLWGIDQHHLTRTHYRQLRSDSENHFAGTTARQSTEQGHENRPSNHILSSGHLPELNNLPGLGEILSKLSSARGNALVGALLDTITASQSFPIAFPQYFPMQQRETPCWWIPEGGNNPLSIWSIAYWAKITLEHFANQGDPGDHWFLPIGSSATFKGILAGFSCAESAKIPALIGVPIFKNSHYITQEIEAFYQQWIAPEGTQLDDNSSDNNNQKNANPQWALWHGQEAGGFGKVPQILATRAQELQEELSTPLDRVYTLKVAYALANHLKQAKQAQTTNHLSTNHQSNSSLNDLLDKNGIAELGKICFLHTGGLQGDRPLT